MDLMERERKDPNWRDRELKKLTEPLLMEFSVASEMALANHQMRCHEAMESLSPEERTIFIAGLKECLDYWGEVNGLERNRDDGTHYICNAWVNEANAKVARHIT